MFSLSEAGFWRFLRQKDSNKSSIEAIKRYLLYGLENVNNHPLVQVCNIQDLINIIIKRSDKLKAIVFIDGDNASHVLKNIHWIVPEIHFAITFSRQSISSKIYGLEKRNWFTILQPIHNTFAATNTSLIIQAASLNVHLSSQQSIPFFIVTTNQSGKELISQLIVMGRKCELIDVSVEDLGLHLLLSVNTLFSPIAEYLLNKLEEMPNLSTEIFDNFLNDESLPSDIRDYLSRYKAQIIQLFNTRISLDKNLIDLGYNMSAFVLD